MKFVLLTSVIVFAGCVETRSQELACGPSDSCEGPRICIDGFCVLGNQSGDAAAIDSTGGSDADTVCPDVCSSCVAGTCVIDCVGGLACADAVVCPPGLACDVNCEGSGSCGGGVDCSETVRSCNVACTGDGSCDGPIDCGSSRCIADCAGSPSCTGGLDCSASCACDTSCGGTGACAPAPMCVPGNPCTQGGNCRSDPGSCNSC